MSFQFLPPLNIKITASSVLSETSGTTIAETHHWPFWSSAILISFTEATRTFWLFSKTSCLTAATISVVDGWDIDFSENDSDASLVRLLVIFFEAADCSEEGPQHTRFMIVNMTNAITCKIFHHINPYRWKDFPFIMILNYQTWENSHSISHLLQFWLPNSTYYDFKEVNMENSGHKTIRHESHLWRKLTNQYLILLCCFKYESWKQTEVPLKSETLINGSGSRGSSISSLFLSHRADLLSMDTSLYPLLGRENLSAANHGEKFKISVWQLCRIWIKTNSQKIGFVNKTGDQF